MDIKESIYHYLKKLKYRILYPLNVFENEVEDIRMSNENIRRYKIQHLRKAFFSISIKGKDDVFKYLYYLLILVLIVLLPFAALRNGISEKEVEQHHRAELLYQYYANNNPAILEYTDTQTHTQSIDFLCYCLTKWLHIESVYDVRHLVGALLVWLIIIVTGSYLMNLFSWRAAFFGSLFLVLSPHFMGQSFGNLNDICFSFFYLMAIYQIYTLIGELPIVKWKRLAFIIISIAAATSIHVGGFTLLHYMFISVIVAFIVVNPITQFFTRRYFKNLGILILIMMGISAIVYLLYALYPLHGIRSLAVLPHHGVLDMTENQPIINILWGGQILSSHDLTVGFIFKRLQFTVPLLIIAGIILHFVVIKNIVKKVHLANLVLLGFALLYPLWTLQGEVCEIYDGWAIYLMIYPFLVMFAAAGYEGLLRKVDDKYTNFVIVSAMLLLSFMPLRHTIFHYQTLGIYFNELSGGISASAGKYSIDEGENANKTAFTWLIKNADRNVDSLPLVVYTDGNHACDYYFRNHSDDFTLMHSTLQNADTLTWDYFVCFIDAADPHELKSGKWAKTKSKRRFYVENQPVALILHRNRPIIIENYSIDKSFEETDSAQVAASNFSVSQNKIKNNSLLRP
ncbi:MAG: hypothetical protein MJZ49_02750 [Bacteroidales bacterium]|nr:hypothetical protein [Bacteroidales bacterium]